MGSWIEYPEFINTHLTEIETRIERGEKNRKCGESRPVQYTIRYKVTDIVLTGVNIVRQRELMHGWSYQLFES